jgi:hypothetical protein
MTDTSYIEGLWEKYSEPLEIIEPTLPIFFRGLGRIECDLIRRFDTIDFEDYPNPKNKIIRYGTPEFTDFLTLSHLWVMGIYEIVRTLCQKSKEKKLFSETARQHLDIAKSFLERVRVPLAKIEPCRKNKEGYSYPVIYYNSSEGMVWHIGDEEQYSMFKLRFHLFNALDFVHRSWSENKEKNLCKK